MTPFSRFAYALGRLDAGWRFASADLRRVTALALVADAWEIVRRDAGAGNVGPAHEATSTHVLHTEDSRRDALLLWLADHAAPALRDAAAYLARMVGAETRFAPADLASLALARDALAVSMTETEMGTGPVATALGPDGGTALAMVAAAVDRLRREPGFVEAADGAPVRSLAGVPLRPRGAPPAPGAAWALNLAILADRAVPMGAPAPIGIASRALFQPCAEADAVADRLVTDALSACERAYRRLVILDGELTRGRAALAHLSRHARTRDAWGLVAALHMPTRRQLARALGLSRGGADVQAHALAGAGLVTLMPGGGIAYASAPAGSAPPLDAPSLVHAMEAVDRDLAAIGRFHEQS